MKNNLQALIATGTAGLVVGASAAAQTDTGAGRYFGHSGMMGWNGWFYGPVMMVVFFALLVGAVVLVVRLLGTDMSRSGPKTEDDAHAILRQRFARGEISRDEFEASRKVLDGDAP